MLRFPHLFKGGISVGFFEIIGPVMIGPSSSHTAGAARLGKLARACWGEEPIEEVVLVLRGSFASTSRGHGTDKALVAGLLGMEPDDEGLRTALETAREQGLPFRFEQEDVDGAHPNSVRFRLFGRDGRTMEIVGASVGGGAVEIQEIDGFAMGCTGELPTLITFHRDVHGVVAAVAALFAERKINIASMTLHRKAKGGLASLVSELDMDADGGLAPDLHKAIKVAHPAILRVIPLYGKGGPS